MRAGIYSRQSFAKRTSIEQQEAAGRGWCDQEQHDVAFTWRDGSSASRFATKARSDWEKVRAAVRARDLEVLVLWESSRGDREAETWLGFLRECRASNVRIHVINHHRTYDISRSRDWRTLAEDGIDNAYESEKTSERVTRNVLAAAAQGRPHGRNQYGYQRNYDAHTGQLTSVTIHPVQAAVIREAARRVLAGETTYAVAQDFNARGIPTPRGGKWTSIPLRRLLAYNWDSDTSPLGALMREAAARELAGDELRAIAHDFTDRGETGPQMRWDPVQIKRILTNPAYNGRRTHLGSVAADAIWPAILDDDTYAQLVARLRDPARGTRRDSAVKHLLSGIAKCGRDGCDGRMRIFNNRGNKTYTCTGCFKVGRIQVKVDGVVQHAVIEFLAQPNCRDVLVPEDHSGDIQAAMTEVAALRARLDGFYDQAAAGALTPAGLARVEQRLLTEIEAAERRTRRITVAPVLDLAIGPDAATRWEQLVMSQRREIVSELVTVRILPMGRGKRSFDPESVEILWRHESGVS